MSRSSFRTKLVLSFLLAALVPLTLTLAVTSSMLSSTFIDDATQRVARSGRLLQSQFAREGRDLAARLDGMARDVELTQLLSNYLRRRPRAQSDLIRWLERALTERDLALLQLTSRDGTIVASGLEPGRFGARDARAVSLFERHGQAVLLAMEEGLNIRGLALKASRLVGDDDRPLILTGGVLLNQPFLSRLPIVPPDALVVIRPNGSILTSPSEEGDAVRTLLEERPPLAPEGSTAQRLRDAGYLVEPVGLEDVEAVDEVELLLATSRHRLDELLRKFNLAFAALAVTGIALAWISGLLLSRPVSLQIDRLVEALERVAAGNLDARVEVRRDDELGQVARALNNMTRDLADNKEKLLAAERVAAWQEIARRLAHEIKNPLSPIQLSIETLRKCYRAGRDDFGNILDESTATVLEEVQRLRRIVEEFSDFARLPKPRLVEEDIHDVIRNVIALHTGLDERYRFRTKLDADPSHLLFDPDQLHRVFVNLIKNAIEAMPDGGEITTSTRRGRERFLVTVRDSGPGVSEAARARLFRPYSTTKAGGTGLGLAIAHRIVSEHRGELTLNADVESGAEFQISLPLPESD